MIYKIDMNGLSTDKFFDEFKSIITRVGIDTLLDEDETIELSLMNFQGVHKNYTLQIKGISLGEIE